MQLVSPEGCTGQGLVSIVMTMPAQQRGQAASKLQVSHQDRKSFRLSRRLAPRAAWPNMILAATCTAGCP